MASSKQKLAIITGGSKGIGKAIAEELADMGYELLLVATDATELNKTAGSIAKKKTSVGYFVCDLSNAKEIDALYDFCKSKKVIPSLLVNNAGIYIAGSTAEAKLSDFDQVLNVNTRGMFYLTQKLLPMLKKAENPRIIIVSSVWALDLYPVEGKEDGTIYSISKWALRGWARSLREEVRKDNIGVTIIYPGAVLTDIWEGTEMSKERFIPPSDIGKAVRAILSTSEQTIIEELTIMPLSGHLHE